jgi:hypothetical protein
MNPIHVYFTPFAFIGGPLHGQSAAGVGVVAVHEHVRQLGIGQIHTRGVKVTAPDPVEYRARVADFYHRMSDGHFRHASLTDDQARGLLK